MRPATECENSNLLLRAKCRVCERGTHIGSPPVYHYQSWRTIVELLHSLYCLFLLQRGRFPCALPSWIRRSSTTRPIRPAGSRWAAANPRSATWRPSWRSSGPPVAAAAATYRDGGVQFLHLAHTPVDFLPGFDVVVVLNWARGLRLRQEFRLRVPLVLWLSHAPDQPVVSSLAQQQERDVWNGFAFVSQWQQERFVEQFRIPRDKARVIRYAISPAFASTPLAPCCLERREPPVLVYTSTPFRGLDVLLLAFRTIRRAIPDVRLRVFSSMAIYQVAAGQDHYTPLYTQCAADGLDYCGPVGGTSFCRGVAVLRDLPIRRPLPKPLALLCWRRWRPERSSLRPGLAHCRRRQTASPIW